MIEQTDGNEFREWCVVESWRSVIGYEGLYEVSSLGRIRRVGQAAKTGKGQGGGARIGRVLRHQIGKRDRYHRVQLWRDGRYRMCLVHVLVATAFLGEPPIGYEVNHVDGDKSRNGVANLEYMTHSENVSHAYRTGLRSAAAQSRPSSRQKPRRIVECTCGCGERFVTPDSQGREHQWLRGHNSRRSA